MLNEHGVCPMLL